jgi:molybdenum-dependent DNA-binding transcriptional regulator ModE
MLHNKRKIIVKGNEYESVKQACDALGVHYGNTRRRLSDLPHQSQEAIDLCFEKARRPGGQQIKVKGELFLSLRAAAKAHDINYYRVRKDLKLFKNPTQEQIDDCFDGQIKRTGRGRPGKAITIDGVEYPSINQAAKTLGMKFSTVHRRLTTTEKIDERCFEPVSKGHKIEVEGVTFETIKDACKHYNQTYEKILWRLGQLGDVPKQADIDYCFKTKRLESKSGKKIVVEGKQFGSINSAALSYGIKTSTVSGRLQRLKNPTPEQIDQCFTTQKINRTGTQIVVEDQTFESISSACEYYDQPVKRVLDRLKVLKEKTPENIDECFLKEAQTPRNQRINDIRYWNLLNPQIEERV